MHTDSMAMHFYGEYFSSSSCKSEFDDLCVVFCALPQRWSIKYQLPQIAIWSGSWRQAIFISKILMGMRYQVVWVYLFVEDAPGPCFDEMLDVIIRLTL
ncbi:hypothetical protein VQ7734_04934 [Vibrio quintilis]|uniref:Uncharacterized protein n=1 Tax=Vibrio quintilis TaxID=1117707 RepID=A0A1M7Z2T9_9VIBR|nr:hypothetical protein VQ7734_04934 [Vibrio quintilis]